MPSGMTAPGHGWEHNEVDLVLRILNVAEAKYKDGYTTSGLPLKQNTWKIIYCFLVVEETKLYWLTIVLTLPQNLSAVLPQQSGPQTASVLCCSWPTEPICAGNV